MKARERAIQDLSNILIVANDLVFEDYTYKLDWIVHQMYLRGWYSVHRTTLLDTARGLGFTVVGSTIYGLDE